MFMNTGISTYIWVLNKNKPSYRCGKVQLIDASHCFEPRRKSIGSKRNDITDLCRDLIVKAYGDFRNDEIYGEKEKVYCQSKIFDNDEFGYYKIVVERPFRPTYSTAEDRLKELESIDPKNIPDPFDDLRGFGEYDPLPYRAARVLRNTDQNRVYYSEKEFLKANSEIMECGRVSTNSMFLKYLFGFLCKHDPNAPIQYKKGKPVPNPDLRDTENVPMTEDIDEYFAREVLPYAPDAWIDKSKTKVGYEIPMTRYFYEYQAPEKVEDIMSRLSALEADIQTSLNALFGGDKP